MSDVGLVIGWLEDEFVCPECKSLEVWVSDKLESPFEDNGVLDSEYTCYDCGNRWMHSWLIDEENNTRTLIKE